MTRTMRSAVAALALIGLPSIAEAGERFTDGVMGALAGALVAGPVGAVVGGGIGYTAGPNISNGISGHHHRRPTRHRSHRHRR